MVEKENPVDYYGFVEGEQPYCLLDGEMPSLKSLPRTVDARQTTGTYLKLKSAA